MGAPQSQSSLLVPDGVLRCLPWVLSKVSFKRQLRTLMGLVCVLLGQAVAKLKLLPELELGFFRGARPDCAVLLDGFYFCVGTDSGPRISY